MSCLVNPYSWRLYYRQVWKVNYFVNNNTTILLSHKTKVLYEILNNIFNKFNVNLKLRNYMRLYSFKTFIFFNKIFILLKFRLNWSNLFKSLMIASNRFLRRYSRFYYNFANRRPKYKIKKLLLRKLKKRKHYFIFFGNEPKNFHIQSKYLNLTLKKKRFKFIKIILIHFAIIPIFLTIKKHLLLACSGLFSKSISIEPYFFNVSWNKFNPQSMLILVHFLLTKKKYSPIKTLYTVIRIMDKIKKRQHFRGYKILLAGRFSRRDRATYLWKTFGSVNLSSRLSNVEYFFKSIQLQYSKCIVKFWICRA